MKKRPDRFVTGFHNAMCFGRNQQFTPMTLAQAKRDVKESGDPKIVIFKLVLVREAKEKP